MIESAGGEPLPLFLDEALVHWDERRLDRGLLILRTISERRQVFFFTCHRELYRILVGSGAKGIELPEPAPIGR